MRLGLGPTNPGTITVALETLLLRPTGFSPVLRLLIPAFSLDTAPPYFTIRLHRNINAPLPLYTRDKTKVKNRMYCRLAPALGLSPYHIRRHKLLRIHISSILAYKSM